MSLVTAVVLILGLVVPLGLMTLIDRYRDSARANLLNPARVRWGLVFMWLWSVSLVAWALPARSMLQDAWPNGPPWSVVLLVAFGIPSLVALALLAFAWLYTLLVGALAWTIESGLRRLMPSPPS